MDLLQKSLILTGESNTVWDDWKLLTAESSVVREWVAINFPHLKLFKNLLFVSDGTQSNFHIDRFQVYHLLHRILIPLDDNYSYEWILNEKVHSYEPKIGEALLFNNMVPHRFVSKNNKKRQSVYLDLYDPLTEKLLTDLKGNYSQENAFLEKKYK